MSMTVKAWTEPLYPETPIEICIDFDPVFTGTAEEAQTCHLKDREVEEVYISIDGTKLVVSVAQIRKTKKK